MLAQPQPGPSSLSCKRIPGRNITGRQAAVAVRVLGEGQADLLQVVLASGPARLLPRGLDGRQEQGDQRPDDRDDHQELDEGEAGRTTWSSIHPRASKRPVHVINPWRDAQPRTTLLPAPFRANLSVESQDRPRVEKAASQMTRWFVTLDLTPCMESKQADVPRATRWLTTGMALELARARARKAEGFPPLGSTGPWSIRAMEIPRVCRDAPSRTRDSPCLRDDGEGAIVAARAIIVAVQEDARGSC